MEKILYNTETQLFQPYTNRLGEDVVGLEPPLEIYALVQNERPEYNPATHHLQPVENTDHAAKEVTRGWAVVENPVPAAPSAEPIQVRAFLLRSGIPLESIPALITAVTVEGVEREEALMRWDKTLSFPKNHPLVAAVAGQLGLNLNEVWSSILAIE